MKMSLKGTPYYYMAIDAGAISEEERQEEERRQQEEITNATK